MRPRMLIIVTFMLVAGAASAQIYVHPGGAGDALTIQAGIDLCPDNGTVLVAAGIYTGEGNKTLDIETDKNLTLISESGAEATIIDLENAGRALYLTNQQNYTTVIDGFTMINGNGGCVYCYMSSPTIRNCIFRDNNHTYGGTGTGAAIYYWPAGGGAKIENCDFIDNTASYGGAIYMMGTNAPEVVDCRFIGNRSYYHGGAIFATNGVIGPIRDCHFYGNRANNGAGVYIQWTVPLLITNCTFSYNEAYGGGGIGINGSGATVENSVIVFSTDGGAIWCNTPGVITVTDCLIFGNVDGDEPCGTTLRGYISEDPQFCGSPEDGNCRLQSDSPCLPENNDFGILLGAWPVGCGETSAQTMSWSRIKGLY
ncbi:MAG: hypothetical protein GY835_00990 [bacterium]|nr:hypothetical protein [bacterium]